MKTWYGHTRVRVAVGVTVRVGVGVGVPVEVGVSVCVSVPVGVGVAVRVDVSVGELVDVGVAVTGTQSRKCTSTLPPLVTDTATASGEVDSKPGMFSSTTM